MSLKWVVTLNGLSKISTEIREGALQFAIREFRRVAFDRYQSLSKANGGSEWPPPKRPQRHNLMWKTGQLARAVLTLGHDSEDRRILHEGNSSTLLTYMPHKPHEPSGMTIEMLYKLHHFGTARLPVRKILNPKKFDTNQFTRDVKWFIQDALDEIAANTPAPPKKRGRPKKTPPPDPTVPIVKNPVGRPRTRPIYTGPPRPVGRPVKSKQPMLFGLEKRKPGRPRVPKIDLLFPVPKRGVGRPKKPKPPVTAEKTFKNEIKLVKRVTRRRKRGRPPKSS